MCTMSAPTPVTRTVVNINPRRRLCVLLLIHGHLALFLVCSQDAQKHMFVFISQVARTQTAARGKNSRGEQRLTHRGPSV